jgi:CheY-like chemotaxis protein
MKMGTDLQGLSTRISKKICYRTAEPRPDEEKKSAPDKTPGYFDQRLRRRVRILVAEDDQSIRSLFEMILRSRGWEVIAVGDGQETVEAWQAGSIDLILMDVHMPVMDGLDATRIIRKREEGTGRHTPIIALTAYRRKEEWQKSLEAGMDDYLTKPINRKLLFASIERLLVPEK